jgi:WD40 repeat protein
MKLEGDSPGIRGMAFSPDGSRVAVALGGGIQVWDARNGTASAMLRGHRAYASTVSFSRDGRMIISGSDDMTVRIWHVSSTESNATHKGLSRKVAFSKDGKRVVAPSWDGRAGVWNAETWEMTTLLQGLQPTQLRLAGSGSRL